jgi:acetyl esterase
MKSFARFLRTIGLALAGISAMLPGAWAEINPTPERTTLPREEHVYKKIGTLEERLFVIKPPGWQAQKQYPAIVLFHGGGWVGGEPDKLDPQANYFARRGMVSVLVEYRLLAKDRKEPPTTCVQDAKSAMRWVRAHASELGVNPQRIAAGGGSAGGHLAAFVGMVAGLDDPKDDQSVSPKANALVLFNPVFNNGPDGWGHERVGERYREFSPAHNITSNAPPAIVFLGAKDRLVSVQTVKDFQAGMKTAGVRCDAFFYEGQGHGFFNRDPWRTQTLVEADKFLTSLGWLQSEPGLNEPKTKESGRSSQSMKILDHGIRKAEVSKNNLEFVINFPSNPGYRLSCLPDMESEQIFVCLLCDAEQHLASEYTANYSSPPAYHWLARSVQVV